jgi:hypothetical protein
MTVAEVMLSVAIATRPVAKDDAYPTTIAMGDIYLDNDSEGRCSDDGQLVIANDNKQL